MESLKHIEKLLISLQKKIAAQSIFLIETSGQILFSSSSNNIMDPTALASLLVGLSAAGQQLGTMFGEKTSPIFVQEGRKVHVLSTFISKDTLLAIVFRKGEKVGYARFKVKQYHPVLKALTDRLKYERKTVRNPLANVTEDEVDHLLGL